MSHTLDIVEIIKLLLKKKKILIWAGIIAIIVSVLVSLVLPNYYESTVTFYPSDPKMTDRSLLFQSEMNFAGNTFGDKLDADRLISIGKSGQIVTYCVQEFDLYKHFDIDPNAKYAHFKMNERFSKNYTIQKNEYGAVEVHVLDQNPDLAAKMANSIVKKIDEIHTGMVSSNKQEIVKLFESESTKKKKDLEYLQDSLRALIQSGADTISIHSLKKIIQTSLVDYNQINTLYNQNLASANKNLSAVFIVEQAYPADKKIKPKRSYIVIGALLFTLFSTACYIILVERLKVINWKS